MGPEIPYGLEDFSIFLEFSNDLKDSRNRLNSGGNRPEEFRANLRNLYECLQDYIEGVPQDVQEYINEINEIEDIKKFLKENYALEYRARED